MLTKMLEDGISFVNSLRDESRRTKRRLPLERFLFSFCSPILWNLLTWVSNNMLNQDQYFMYVTTDRKVNGQSFKRDYINISWVWRKPQMLYY